MEEKIKSKNISKSRDANKISENSEEEHEKDNLPQGVMLLSQYKSKIDELLDQHQGRISKYFYTRIIPEDVKITLIMELNNESIIGSGTFKVYFKFNNKLIMNIEKKIFGKYYIRSENDTAYQTQVIAKLSSSINKSSYKLYQKNLAQTNTFKGNSEFAFFKFNQSDMVILPKVDENIQIRRRIVESGMNFLEKQYKQSRSRVTCLKLYRSVFQVGDFLKKYYFLKDQQNIYKSNPFALRKINQGKWQINFSYPLAIVQAIGITLAIIDKQ